MSCSHFLHRASPTPHPKSNSLHRRQPHGLQLSLHSVNCDAGVKLYNKYSAMTTHALAVRGGGVCVCDGLTPSLRNLHSRTNSIAWYKFFFEVTFPGIGFKGTKDGRGAMTRQNNNALRGEHWTPPPYPVTPRRTQLLLIAHPPTKQSFSQTAFCIDVHAYSILALSLNKSAACILVTPLSKFLARCKWN